jgi:hypothetical protein
MESQLPVAGVRPATFWQTRKSEKVWPHHYCPTSPPPPLQGSNPTHFLLPRQRPPPRQPSRCSPPPRCSRPSAPPLRPNPTLRSHRRPPIHPLRRRRLPIRPLPRPRPHPRWRRCSCSPRPSRGARSSRRSRRPTCRPPPPRSPASTSPEGPPPPRPRVINPLIRSVQRCIWGRSFGFWLCFCAGAVEAMKDTLSRWGKSMGETTKMVESLSRDTWQHCEISAPQ